MPDGTAAADEAFGAALQRAAASAGNLVFSPASIAAALRMTLCGARGQTADEIAAALHLDDPAQAADGLRLLSAGLAELPGDGLVFRAPNTMWLQAGYPVEPAFIAALRDAAAVSVRDADFMHAAEAARREINDLIGKQTEGKINNLIAPGVLDGDTRLVLANAIYLKSAWRYRFPEQATGDDPFHPGGDAAPVGVPTMHLTENLPYLRGNGFQAVMLPYRGDRLAMIIALPDGPLDPLPPALADGLASLAGQVTRHRITLALPRFRLQTALDLVPLLRELGITLAFDRHAADFTGITTAEQLFVGAVVHQAYIDVDEQGTEAAAATAVTMRAMASMRRPDPITMIVDHPFVFEIIDTVTGLPLFSGRVSDPRPD
ncbi:MAG TPA: serpin family protein [Streptosporangiaceae bacterium]|jgi:serpin B